MRWEGETERKGVVITPITTMGTGGCISWEESRSSISEISQMRVRVLGVVPLLLPVTGKGCCREH